MFSRLQTQTLAFLVLLVFATAWLVTALTCKNLQHYWLQINHQLTRIFMQYSMHDLKLIFTKINTCVSGFVLTQLLGLFLWKIAQPLGQEVALTMRRSTAMTWRWQLGTTMGWDRLSLSTSSSTSWMSTTTPQHSPPQVSLFYSYFLHSCFNFMIISIFCIHGSTSIIPGV